MLRLSQELIKLGDELGRELKEDTDLYGHACGDLLLQRFAYSLDLPDDTKLEVETDRGVTKLIHISRVRKILAGSPPLKLSEGTIGKREAAIALLKMKTHRE